jgi:hypothetical protein
MEPQTPSVTAPRLRAANASFAAVLAAGCFYLIAAPQPDGDLRAAGKQGPTRPTAVESGGPAEEKSAVKSSDSAGAVVKVVGTSVTGSGKACDEQTWPYIETRCLTVADGKSAAAASTRSNATPLGLRNLIAGVRPTSAVEADVKAPAREEKGQPSGRVTAMAPTPAVKDMQANTVSLPLSDTPRITTDGAATRGEDVLLPQPRPDTTLASLSAPETKSDDTNAAPRPMSRAEYRRMEREQRRAARQVERERRRQEWAERRAADRNRIVRRWTEYTYEDDSRTVDIQQGPQRDRFFRSYR